MDLLRAILGTESELMTARMRVLASMGRGDRSLVAKAEDSVRRAPHRSITLDPTGLASLTAGNLRYCAGRFRIRSISELKASVSEQSFLNRVPEYRFSVLEGIETVTDIGALQAMASSSTLFQVASQFNCLVAPRPRLVRVSDYFKDSTQGPRASISAFPATLLRHYAAPGAHGERFVQGPKQQIELLAEALPANLARPENGYLRATHIRDANAVAHVLEERFDLIRVGVHEEAQVILGADWDGSVAGEPRIAQVMSSSIDLGPGGRESGAGQMTAVCRQLLRASYLGTLLAAINLRKDRVVLTMIGGGVYANSHTLIIECLIWALDQVSDLADARLEVILNARCLSPEIDRAWLGAECRARGGDHRVLGIG